jgi:GT2 family glycosyltransferase
MTGVTAVAVTYNSEEVIGSCLESCREYPAIVVDNASTDGTLAAARRFPHARVIANDTNRGFAAAVNQAVRESEADFILLLNPDVILLTDISPLVASCDVEGVGASAGQLLGEDGRPQKGFGLRRFPTPLTLTFEVLGLNRLFPWNPVNRRYRELVGNPGAAGEVDQPAGAFLLFRKRVWERLGGFDEAFYPIWFEDVDFCKRLREAGYKIVYNPAALARHRGGHSVRALPGECRELYWYVSLLRYASKHFRALGFRLVSAAVVPGAILRAITSLVAGGGAAMAATYCRVIRFAGGCLVSGRFPDLPGPLRRQIAAVSSLTGSGQVTPSARNI